MYAEGVKPFRDLIEEAKKPNAYTHLKSLDQEDTCHIAQAADLCIMFTQALDEKQGVHKQFGSVESAAYSHVGIHNYQTLILTELTCLQSQTAGMSSLQRSPPKHRPPHPSPQNI